MSSHTKFRKPLTILSTLLLFAASVAYAGETIRVSVSSSGEQGNKKSATGTISADGRFVAFYSKADNLVTGDTNTTFDAFVHDLVSGETKRVSVNSDGTQGNQRTDTAAISANGLVLAFDSWASNLVAGDTNGTRDVFVHERLSGKTVRVNTSSQGEQGNSYSYFRALNADGRFVAFDSWASNLVANDTNNSGDAFVHDRIAGTTERISVSSSGKQANDYSYARAISADGRFVAFYSPATNLVPNDTSITDAFVHDRISGATARVSVNSVGVAGNLNSYPTAISANGRFVALDSFATNLVSDDTNGARDAFIHDRITGETTRISVSSSGEQGNADSFPVAISADGRFVAFWSSADNLVAGDTNGMGDAFVHDRASGKTTRVDIGSTGNQANRGGIPTGISADGRYITFWSFSAKLVAGDTNRVIDAFVRDRLLNKVKTADLQAAVTAQPSSVPKGQTAHYMLAVTNAGPDDAGSAALTGIVSNGIVTGITASQGQCSKAAVSVCRLGALTAGAEATVTINVKAKADPLKLQISVNAAPKDNAPGNNSVKISTPVTP